MSVDSLMIFAKAPEPGRVKTRLQLSPEQGAAVHSAFVRDVLARHRRPERRMTVWRAGDLAHPFWKTLDVDLAVQGEGDLGRKMEAAFSAELAHDRRVVILGTDSPSLPPRLVDAAFAALETCSLVIGPACDGGYYLLGMTESVAPVFLADMAWGTEEVLPRTLAAAQGAGVPYQVLEFWYDVDRPADLALLRAHLPVIAAADEPLPTHSVAVCTQLELW
jgi:rSAM/selenodomain-associated transferase 1